MRPLRVSVHLLLPPACPSNLLHHTWIKHVLIVELQVVELDPQLFAVLAQEKYIENPAHSCRPFKLCYWPTISPTSCCCIRIRAVARGINPRKFPRLWQQYVQLNSSPQRHQMVHLHVPVSWRIYSTCMIGHSLSDESSYCHYPAPLIAFNTWTV